MKTDRKNKTKQGTERRFLRRFFSVFYAVCIVLSAVFFLLCGTSLAGIGTRRVETGEKAELITLEGIGELIRSLSDGALQRPK